MKKSNNKKIAIIISICVIAIIACIAVALLNRSNMTPEQKVIIEASEMIKEDLLRPSTFILYDAYVSEEWNEGYLSVFLHYGAESAGGIMTEHNALFDGEELRYGLSDDELDDADYEALTGGLHVSIAEYAIATGSEKWQRVEDFPSP